MLKIDPWNIIWTVVNLLFLYWIFKKFLFDRVMGVINQRDEMIQKQFSEAKKSQDDAESLKSDYKKKLESAKTQADQIILDARARAEAEQEKALERTRQEADSMLEKAKADIASEQDKATKAAEAEIAKLAILAARKIVKTGESVSVIAVAAVNERTAGLCIIYLCFQIFGEILGVNGAYAHDNALCAGGFLESIYKSLFRVGLELCIYGGRPFGSCLTYRLSCTLRRIDLVCTEHKYVSHSSSFCSLVKIFIHSGAGFFLIGGQNVREVVINCACKVDKHIYLAAVQNACYFFLVGNIALNEAEIVIIFKRSGSCIGSYNVIAFLQEHFHNSLSYHSRSAGYKYSFHKISPFR